MKISHPIIFILLLLAIGKVNGQYCIVGANDATVKGGTFFPISIVKQLRVQELSYLNHLPSIYLVDSGGAYLPLQVVIRLGNYLMNFYFLAHTITQFLCCMG